jgi:hypothetical protein
VSVLAECRHRLKSQASPLNFIHEVDNPAIYVAVKLEASLSDSD